MPKPKPEHCTAAGCGKPVRGVGLCAAHGSWVVLVDDAEMSFTEAVAALGVSRGTLARRIKAGNVSARKL